MDTDELSAVDKEAVEVLMKFTDKLPTKGLVRVYNSVHPIIDIEGHMTQSRKKNLALFQALRNTDVPNLQESLVEVHVHGGTKRKAELSAQPDKGKDVKMVRAALLGAGSANGTKGPESSLIELPKTFVRKDIAINLPETIINSIDGLGWRGTEAYNGAVAILKLKATFMPRFTQNSRPKVVIGLGSKKTGAKSRYRPRLRRPEAKKVARNFKNAIDVGTYRLRLGKSQCQRAQKQNPFLPRARQLLLHFSLQIPATLCKFRPLQQRELRATTATASRAATTTVALPSSLSPLLSATSDETTT
ncbi:hypothetical protein DEO72_LG4g935 [Vigna unguiculata]|uniref:Uncharacterized protein n=1 Tax=Vigna unguiculata TaxID=3917 RepID=A0A4D6LNB9_VIGUN|nr:hypothetical protein DEO72_LG4g935 [Vigna unguiculata]